MLITILCIYVGVWCCAYAAARRWRGTAAFWGLYAVAVFGVPAACSGVFHMVYARVDAANADTLTATVLLLGGVLAVLSYPLSHARIVRTTRR
jgi:uncharacterized membrane protein HdeD (DUF308 family)